MRGHKVPALNLRLFFALVAQAKPFDERSVPVEVFFPKVPEKLSSCSNHLQEPATGVEVLGVDLKVLRKITNALREHCDLDFRRPRIRSVSAEIFDNTLFLFFLQHFLHLEKKIP
jgi:hypothetical protein